jgi:Fur family ferric uptake transcriptional regulator
MDIGSKSSSRRARAVSPYGAGRTSAQRATIADAAERMSGAFTVEELAEAVRREGGSAGTATVYRAVAAMSQTGHLERVGDRGGKSLYVRCDVRAHHHHLVCTECGSIAETPCPLDDAALSAAGGEGFVVTSHEVTVYGLCRTCSGSSRPAEES